MVVFQEALELHQLFQSILPVYESPPLEKEAAETPHNRLCHVQSPQTSQVAPEEQLFPPCNPCLRTAQGAFSHIRKSRVFQPGESEFATFPSIFIVSLSEQDAATWLCCSSVWA